MMFELSDSCSIAGSRGQVLMHFVRDNLSMEMRTPSSSPALPLGEDQGEYVHSLSLTAGKIKARGLVVTQFVTELRQAVSDPRVERYRRPLTANDLEMLTQYYWNMALADALLCPLGTVEILIRNTIHNTLSNHFGMPNWYDGNGLLEERQLLQVAEAKSNIEGHKKQITPARVVSKLTFGFWVTLISRNYDARFWRANRAENLRAAFPHVPRNKRQRGDIQAKHYRALNLRNLAFHHEPIFDLPSLLDDYRRAYEAIEWIDPTMVAKTQLFDRFPDVHAGGRAAVETTLRTHLGI